MPSLKKLLGFPQEPAYQKQIEGDLARYTMHTGKYMCLMIILSQVAMMLSMSLREGGPFAHPRRQAYFILYLLFFLATLLFVILGTFFYRRASNPARFLRLGALYATVACLWSCAITLNDQYGGNGLNVYIYFILSVSALTVLKPWQSIALFGGSSVLLNALLPFFPYGHENLFNNLTNSTFITLLAIFLSVHLYHYRVQTSYDQIIIKSQYQEIRKINQQLHEIAMTDQLTQMKNRRYLQEVVAPHLLEPQSAGQPVSGVMIDIDFFKEYNDCYGHQQGDVCLQEIAQVIQDLAGDDGYAVRFGGEEFFVCLLGLSKAQAAQTAESIRQGIEDRNVARTDLPIGRVTVSAGLSWSASCASIPLDELVRRADQALYRAKRKGRNQVSCYGSERAQAQ